MFTVYQSNDMDVQRELLSNIIKIKPPTNVFSQEFILVQNTGMSQWLKLSLSETIGVVANTVFPMPSAFLWRMFQMIVPNIEDVTPFSKDVIRWRLIKLLKKHKDDPKLASIQTYLNIGDSNDPEYKLFQLAEKVADLYDQYQVLRPEWISEWEDNDFTSVKSENDQWQPYLWNLIIEDMVSDGINTMHRADLLSLFMNTVESGDFNKQQIPERIFVFGINNIAPQFLHCLKALSKYTDVYWFNVTPCKYFFGDILNPRYIAAQKNKKHYSATKPAFSEIDSASAIGNSLLASLGKVGRDHLTMLQDIEYDELDVFVDIDGDTLLSNIQRDVLNLEEESLKRSPQKRVLAERDNSLIISSSYSKTREIEALQDYLLNLFKSDPSLKPNDIVVMCASIDDYAPAIHSVFGSTAYSPLSPIGESNPSHRDDHYIPYNVSDRTLLSENPILESFVSLLSLTTARNTSSEIIKILETPSILERFGINTADFETIFRWINDAGIKWGLDENTATQEHSTTMNTWLFGVQRMLLSYTLSPSFGNYEDCVGYENINTGNARIAGGLSLFIEKCIELRNELNKSKTIHEWIGTLNLILDEFFVQDNDNEKMFSLIRDKVIDLFEQSELTQFSDTTTSNIIRSYFISALKKESISQNFVLGKVTFATLMPMRSIPFKHICLLGMNDGIYPRSQIFESWDMIAKNPKLGDRTGADDDKFLFLEAILAAKESIYISYVGRSIKDNTMRYPSSLVSELIEYCSVNYEYADDSDVIDNMSRNNPLSVFSRDAFTDSVRLKSFAQDWLPVVNNQSTCTTPPPIKFGVHTNKTENQDTSNNITLQEIKLFWEMPVRTFFTKTLNTNMYKKDICIEDCEDFEISSLSGYKFKTLLLDKLLRSAIDEDSDADKVFNDMYQDLLNAGQLPVGHFGKTGLETIKDPVVALARTIQPRLKGIKPSSEFELDICGIKLSGFIPDINERNSIVRYRSGRIRPQDIINAWIEYLIGVIEFDVQAIYLSGLDAKYKIDGITRDAAIEILPIYIDAYNKGIVKPLAFIPDLASSVIKALTQKGKLVPDFEKRYAVAKGFMKQAMFGDAFSLFKSSDNEYVHRTWNELSDDDYRDFFNNTIKYLVPINKCMSIDED